MVILWLRASSPCPTCSSFTTPSISHTNCSNHVLNYWEEQNWCPCARNSINSESNSTMWLISCMPSPSRSKFESPATRRVLYAEWQITAFSKYIFYTLRQGLWQPLKRNIVHKTHRLRSRLQNLCMLTCQRSSAQPEAHHLFNNKLRLLHINDCHRCSLS